MIEPKNQSTRKTVNQPMVVIQFFVLISAVLASASETTLATMPIDTGYGANGAHAVFVDSTPHPAWKGRSVYLFYPDSVAEPPLYLFFHGIGGDDPHTYYQLVTHIVSRGNALVYSPFDKAEALMTPQKVYHKLWSGMEKAVGLWGSRFDTTRVGFVGHSYGGGAVPALSRRALVNRGWGGRGAFLFVMAPWYSHQISTEELATFPARVNMVMQVYEDDKINDHRMAIDIFKTIGIPDDHKAFLMLRNDSCAGHVLLADHSVPAGSLAFGPRMDAFDYHGVYRLLDALAGYTFNADLLARRIVLGPNTEEQRYMGRCGDGTMLQEMKVYAHPSPTRHMSEYLNFWNHAMNPRASSEVGSRWSAGAATQTVKGYMRSPLHRMMVEERREDEEDARVAEEEELAEEGEEEPSRCWVAQIDSGYGAEGPYRVAERSFPNTYGDGELLLAVPQEVEGRVPLVLIAPEDRWGSPDYYRELIRHIAGRGMVVAFSSYRSGLFVGNNRRYNALFQGLRSLEELVIESVDTTRVGFVGHGYGGGALPALTYDYLATRGWGGAGAYMFIMAPYYVYRIEQRHLSQFPKHVKLLVQVYNEDEDNDWRMAEDIFYNMGIHPSEKDYVVVRTFEHGDDWCEIQAETEAPLSKDRRDLEQMNAIDFYAIFRLVDALADYAFTGNPGGKAIALGNGSAQQVYMGTTSDGTVVPPMIVTDNPASVYPHDVNFTNEWGGRRNKRKAYYRPE